MWVSWGEQGGTYGEDFCPSHSGTKRVKNQAKTRVRISNLEALQFSEAL